MFLYSTAQALNIKLSLVYCCYGTGFLQGTAFISKAASQWSKIAVLDAF